VGAMPDPFFYVGRAVVLCASGEAGVI
jgi:hypothetical protein